MKRICAALAALTILLALVSFGAVFPGGVAGDADLLVAYNAATSTLNGAINNSVTTFSVVSGTTFGNNMAVTIESETIFCTGLATATFSGCTRGYGGTTPAAHSNGATVSGFLIAAHHNTLAAEIKAIETALVSGYTGAFSTLFSGVRKVVISGTVNGLTSDSGVCWKNNADWDAGGASVDTCLLRNASGVVEFDNGTPGAYRDAKLRTLKRVPLTVSTLPGTPADGDMVWISDSIDGSCVAGSGAIRVQCIYNGTAWIAH